MMGNNNTTPKGLPQTPPASTRKGNGQKPIPKFQLPDITPRKSENGLKADHSQLQTPATTRRITNRSPNANLGLGEGTNLFPPSPDFTPQRSPRGKRKKLSFESLSPLLETISALLPKHATIGSGRKHEKNTLSFGKPHAQLNLAELFELNQNLGFEEDDVPESPTRKGRPRKNFPVTPGKQLITEEKVRSWHGSSFCGGFSSDEDDEKVMDLKQSVKLENPFIDTTTSNSNHKNSLLHSRKSNPFMALENAVNYDTHMELINHRTGQRKVELLLEEQRRFKPKKIDFSGI